MMISKMEIDEKNINIIAEFVGNYSYNESVMIIKQGEGTHFEPLISKVLLENKELSNISKTNVL